MNKLFVRIGLKFLLVAFLMSAISSVSYAGLSVESASDGISGMTISWSWSPEEPSSSVLDLTYWDVQLSISLFDEENDIWYAYTEFQHLYHPCVSLWEPSEIGGLEWYISGSGVIKDFDWMVSHHEGGVGCYDNASVYMYRDENDPSQNGIVLDVHHIYVPEPATLCLFSLGGLALRKKRKA